MKRFYLILPALLAVPAGAQAAGPKLDFASEYTDYSGNHGTRHETSVEGSYGLGSARVVLNGSHGRREYDDRSFSGLKGAATVYHDWTDRLQTRTRVALSTNGRVFANREIAQDISFNLARSLTVTAGAKYARYFGNTDVLSWSLGGNYYLKGVMMSYRYSSYDTEGLDGTHGHLASIRVADGPGAGSTQLWLGSGSSLHEHELATPTLKGKQRGVALQRIQPLKGDLALVLRAGHTRYSTGNDDFTGTRAGIGFAYAPRRLFK